VAQKPLALKMLLLSNGVLYQMEGEFQIGPQIYTDKHRSVKIRVNPCLNCVCIAGEHGGAYWSTIETKLCRHDLRRFKAWLKRPAFYFVDDWVED
jgi:hypothetical protein